MTIVRIARVQAWPGKLADGRFLVGGALVVLADDTGHRALPVWLERDHGVALRWLLELADEPEKDMVRAGRPEELAARLLHAAGASVAGVTISLSGQATGTAADVLTPHTSRTRIELASPAGPRHTTARLGLALAVAAAAGAPVRVADAVMDRMGVPVRDGDLADLFRDRVPPPGQMAADWPVTSMPARLPRFEARNLDFAEGLDRWNLEGGFLREADGPQARDYAAAAGTGSAVLRSAVPYPLGSAALIQTIFADDYRGATVVFRGEIRTEGVIDQAGLHLHISSGKGREREDHGIAIAGHSDWTRYEVRAVISGNANVIQFGIALSGPGLVALRGPELAREA